MTETTHSPYTSVSAPLPTKEKRTLQERLTAVEHAAHTLNEKSNTLSATLTAVEKQLTAAGIGLEVWTAQLLHETTDDENRITGRELGYAKIGSNWHLAVRDTAFDIDIDGDVENEWNGDPVPLAQCSRQERIKALEYLPQLLDKLEAMAQQAIKTIDDTSALVALD